MVELSPQEAVAELRSEKDRKEMQKLYSQNWVLIVCTLLVVLALVVLEYVSHTQTRLNYLEQRLEALELKK